MKKSIKDSLFTVAVLAIVFTPFAYICESSEPIVNADIQLEDNIHWKDEDAILEEDVHIDEIEVEVVQKAPTMRSLGEFQLTAYCPCRKCSNNWGTQTATGAVATEGRTVAVDPKVIPYGTVLVINGHEYIAEDCGGAIKGNKIDIFFESHDEALEFGIQYAEVFICH